MFDHKAAFPPEAADRFTKLFGRFLKIEAAAGAALLVATCAARCHLRRLDPVQLWVVRGLLESLAAGLSWLGWLSRKKQAA